MTGKNSVTEINDRHLKLQDIQAEFEMKGKDYTQTQLLSALKKEGFEIDIRTLQRDLESISSSNNFVTKLATVNYSNFVDTCFKKLDRAEQACMKIYNKKWTQSKHVKKQVPIKTKEGLDTIEVTETVVTAELAAPKLAAQKLYADIQKIKLEMVSGNLLDDSVAAMTKRFQELQKQLETLQEENQSLKEQKGGPIVLANSQN